MVRRVLTPTKLLSGTLLLGLGVMACLYSRSWPFPPWADYAITEAIDIRGFWKTGVGLQNVAVVYAANGQPVADPMVRYEVLRQARGYIAGPTESGGRVSLRGRFYASPCRKAVGWIASIGCREYTWEWVVPEFVQGAPEDETPLMTASWRGDTNAVRNLLQKGADPNAQDVRGRTTLWYAKTPEITKMLLGSRANIEAKDKEGMTPLMLAAYSRDVAKINPLLAAGASLTARSEDGRTPLLWAARQRLYKQDPPGTEAVRLLLSAGANPNAHDRKGTTALMLAASDRELETVRLLLVAGATCSAKNNRGETALSIAGREGPGEIIEALKKAGCHR